MKKILPAFFLAVSCFCAAQAQQRISKKEIELLKSNLKENPLLQDGDEDFKENMNTDKWAGESAVILCQKTTFDFDRRGVSVGKRIGRNILGILFALPTLGTSMVAANTSNETKILIEETERRKILLRDKFALEQYSVLYFRLSAEGDAFAARVIKKDGSKQDVDLSEAIRIDDIKSVPGIFRSYTDGRFTSAYRPDYFKLAVPDLEEGDMIEYEFRNFNTQYYSSNPNYKEFDPVYYLCNRDMPVAKQVIEVVAQDDKYYIGYKSLKGAPDFTRAGSKGKKVYRWVDNNRDKMTDTRYVNEFIEMPSVKFQVIYARNSSKGFIWFKDEADMKREMSVEELGSKAKTFWFNPEKLYATGDYTAGLKSSIEGTSSSIYRLLKKRGVTDAAEDDYVRKAYYTIRSQTLYNAWGDYAYAKVFSNLLQAKKIPHEIVVSSSNLRTRLSSIAFSQEISWMIKYKNKYYVNPGEHLNPEEVPVYLAGNPAIRFSNIESKSAAVSEVLPVPDTLQNQLLTQLRVSLDTSKAGFIIDKTTEAKGMMKDDIIDDVLALTPFMETDYRNFDGSSMWEGLSSRQEENAMSEFTRQKKEWKDEKPKMMKAITETDYSAKVEKYDNFRLQQDGRSHKKRSLKYSESFVLADLTATAGADIVLPLPALVSSQTKIRKDERSRSLPIDVRYPRTLSWNIVFTVPAGYTVKGVEGLNRTVINECGSFICTAKTEGNSVVIDVQKVYKATHFEPAQWGRLVEVLDAAYNFSQSKIILKKQ
jgi:hypothetical protein